jgi:hypothetical protein
MTVKLGHDIWDMTSATPLNRTAKTGQSDQVSLTVSLDRTKRKGCQNIIARTGQW